MERKVGNRIVVRNGAKGEQVAVIAAVGLAGYFRVHKWLMKSGRWTKRVTVHTSVILRTATETDFRKRRVKAMAPIGHR